MKKARLWSTVKRRSVLLCDKTFCCMRKVVYKIWYLEKVGVNVVIAVYLGFP